MIAWLNAALKSLQDSLSGSWSRTGKSGNQGKSKSMTNLNVLLIASGCPEELVDTWKLPIQEACSVYEITGGRLPMFLAQVSHESDSFRRTVENLNYGTLGLLRIFGRYFPSEEIAEGYAHNPERIANRVYANRLGNGDEASGDGWKYRGRGLIQLTGKENVREFSKHYFGNESLVVDPEGLKKPYLAAMSAGWYWQSHDCNEKADTGDFEGITKAINGGLTNLQDRLQRYMDIQRVIT